MLPNFEGNFGENYGVYVNKANNNLSDQNEVELESKYDQTLEEVPILEFKG